MKQVKASVTIIDVNALVLPRQCVVCGESDAEVVVSSQDFFPIIAPGVAPRRSIPTALPYCDRHRGALERRFRILGAVQFVIFLALLAFAFSQQLKLIPPLPPAIVLTVIIGLLLLFSVTWVVKPRLYDVWFTYTQGRLTLSSRYNLFIESVKQANRGNIAKVATR